MNETAVGIQHNFCCMTYWNRHWRHSTWDIIVFWVLAEVLQMFTVYSLLFYKLILYCYVVILTCEDLASFCHNVLRVINSYRHLFHNYWRCNCIFVEAVFLTTCIKRFFSQFHMPSHVRRWTSWCDFAECKKTYYPRDSLNRDFTLVTL